MALQSHMPRSSVRKRKQPRQRPTTTTGRETLPASPAAEDAAVGDVDDDLGDSGADVGLAATEDEVPQAAPSRGSVRTVTWRRGRVPYLLNDVIEARADVKRAERLLAKRVKAARAHGATWEDLGLALSMSRQGVAKRYG